VDGVVAEVAAAAEAVGRRAHTAHGVVGKRRLLAERLDFLRTAIERIVDKRRLVVDRIDQVLCPPIAVVNECGAAAKLIDRRGDAAIGVINGGDARSPSGLMVASGRLFAS
jgi:hypothetical protein